MGPRHWACAAAVVGVATALVHAPPSVGRVKRRQVVSLDAKKRPEYFPGRIDDPEYVRIFDTTLRDGEQSPGATLTSSEKLEIARQLAKVGVDIIEAGFPIASPDDFDAVRQIARVVGNEVAEDGYVPVICGLSRANKKDILRAWEAVSPARRPRVHTFIATSKIHMEDKLKKTPAEVVAIARDAVRYAKSLGCDDIEFSPEDAGRSEPAFLYEVLAAVIEEGATTLNIPDTTGWNMPWEFGSLIADLRAKVPNASSVVFSTHCQNDLGLATANSLAGALNGARQIECTINGIGERAGNAALEEVVMALELRGATKFGADFGGLCARLHTGIDTKHITPTSKMVAEYTGMAVQPHKAIVGANAFQHESGIHQDGMIKNKATYEIMTPESVGLMRGDKQSGAGIVLGKHSGRNAVVTRLAELGYATLSPDRIEAVFARFKHYAERKKGGIDDDELEAIVNDAVFAKVNALWSLDSVQVTTGSVATPTATVSMSGPDGVRRIVSRIGSGPVDACYKAIDELMAVDVMLETFGMESVNAGIHALATTKVVVRPMQGTQLESTSLNSRSELVASRKFHGTGSDTDIVVSAARAYISALNKLLTWNLRTRPAVLAAAPEKPTDAPKSHDATSVEVTKAVAEAK